MSDRDGGSFRRIRMLLMRQICQVFRKFSYINISLMKQKKDVSLNCC